MPDAHQADRLSTLSAKKTHVALRVVVAASLFSLVALAATAWGVWALRASALQTAGVSTANMARALAFQADTAFRGTDLALEDMVERAEAGDRSSAGIARLRAHLILMAHKAWFLHDLFMYDEHGVLLASSLEPPIEANNADRAYFQYHKLRPDRETHIGTPIRSRSSGLWVVPVSRRLQHPDGSFAGVALATLRIDFFEDIYDELNLGNSGTVLLALEDGTLLYRRPLQEHLIGRNISEGPVFQTYRKLGPDGTAMLTARVDGIERLYSYRRTSAPPLVVAAGVSSEETLQEWHRLALVIGLALVFVLVLIGYLTRRLLRQLAIRDLLEEGLRNKTGELQQANAHLSAMAWKDGLTGLANRRAFDDFLSRELRRATRNKAPVSLILLDVDYFKRYNDSEGHAAGDECLRRVAGALEAPPGRAGELAARYGGEEFAVILSGTDLAGAAVLADKLRRKIAALAIAHPQHPEGVVTVSAGVACVAGPHEPAACALDLIKAADAMLYAAKQAGRNRVCPTPETQAAGSAATAPTKDGSGDP